MKKVLLFDTSHGTQNMGDFIINRAINEEMQFLLDKCFVVRYGTHNPILRFSQNMKKNRIKDFCNKADYKFICGTNLLYTSLNHLTPGFNINLYDANNYKRSILLGCGMGGADKKADLRTKHIYRKVLSKDYIHSTRDERAKNFIESLGFKAINTGCPTLWMLTKDFCREIPQKKSSRVIFTLTDYCRDKDKDQKIINILKRCYDEVFFWIQGSDDLDYFKSLSNTEDIKLVAPNLEAYEKILNEGNIDYVGTRLHAGIFAMRHKVRSIIIIVDNRARDMKKTYNLVAINRSEINELERIIKSNFETNVNIDVEKIEEWKKQFKYEEE